MTKQNNTIFLVIGIVVLLLVVAKIGFFPELSFFATVNYASQCSLPSCPSGYTSVERYCDTSDNECYRVCEKQLEGSCGSYSSFFSDTGYTKFGWDGKYNSGQTYTTPSYDVDDNYCYKFYPQTSFKVDTWGSADSYSMYITNSWGSNSICSTLSSKSVIADYYTLGRGTDGRGYTASGKVTEYGGSTCDGGQPIFHLKGRLDVDLFVSRASWIEGGVSTKEVSCSYECDRDGDCDTDIWVGTASCSGNNVYQTFRDYYCSSYSCSYSDVSKLRESCTYGCSNGACVTGECNTGDFKCEGTTYYECINSNWANQGKVEGECGYTGKYELGPNQLVAMESFSGGSTISRTSTRYPIVSFIYILPPIVIDADDNSVSTDRTIYDELDDGKTLQIPTSQVWSLFYVIENNYQLTTICDVIDVETGQCAKINPGVVIACSEGQFDPSLGLCVVQPESRIICPEGGRYDVAQGVCIFNPPLQAVCPEGSIYNVNTEQCEYSPDTAYVCDIGFNYNPSTGKCEKYPDQQINCPGGYAYDQAIDMCIRYPDERIICPIGATYNFITDKCEYTPPESYVCQIGFIYNPSTGKCELKPAEQIICGIGTYSENLDLCIYEPQTSIVCSKGILTEISPGNYACIYTPETIEKCPTGTTYNHLTDKCEYYPETAYVCEGGFTYNPSTGKCEIEIQVVCIQGTYDSEKRACVYEPNMEYLCINGELTYETGKAKCIIYPEQSIICPRGFTYDEVSDKCIIYPDYWTAGIKEEIEKISWDNIWEDYKILIILGVAVFLLLILIGGRKR
jgi:hypothetical protein